MPKLRSYYDLISTGRIYWKIKRTKKVIDRKNAKDKTQKKTYRNTSLQKEVPLEDPVRDYSWAFKSGTVNRSRL